MASQHAPRVAPSPSGPRQVGRPTSPGLSGVVHPQAVPDGDVQARSARAHAGHALSVVAIVAHRAGVPVALLAVVVLTLGALAGALPAAEGLVAAVPLVGEWGGSVLRTAVTAVGGPVALRIVPIALAAGAWLVFPPGHRELLAELSRRAMEVERRR